MTISNRLRVEIDEDWHGLVDKIPAIKFDQEWEVKIIPPFGGAIARFQVRKSPDEEPMSVYLDFFERLGYFSGDPYWEVYPIDGDVARFQLNDTSSLIDAIRNENMKGKNNDR